MLNGECKIPTFYLNIVTDWCHNVQTSISRHLFIWYNKGIRIGFQPRLIKEFYENGIRYVGDIMECEDKMALFNKLVKKGVPKNKWLQWQGTVQAVKKYCKNITVNVSCTSSVDVKFQIANRDIEQCNSKFIYNNIVAPPEEVSVGRADKYVKCEEEYQNIYTRPVRLIQDVKTREFQYRFVHDILVNKYWLYKWKLVENDKCRWCKSNTETLYHTFWECQVARHFWKEFNDHFSGFNIAVVDPTTVFYGSDDELQCCLIFAAKRYLYKCIYNEIIPTFNVYAKKIHYMKTIEEQIAMKSVRKMQKWNVKWMPLL